MEFAEVKVMSKGKLEWGRILKKLSPYTIQKGYRYLKHYGPKEFWIRLHERFEPEEVPYGPWYEAYRPTEADLDKQRKRVWKYSPKISIVVPAYKTPEKFLREMMDSLREQTYSNWELCIANASPEDASMEFTLKEYSSFDSRIVWKKLESQRILMRPSPWPQVITLDFWTMMICLPLMLCMKSRQLWKKIGTLM